MVVLSFDDSIEEKQYTDGSELVCWHYYHVFKRSVKGVNFLAALVEVNGIRLPCAVDPIAIGFVKKRFVGNGRKIGQTKTQSQQNKK